MPESDVMMMTESGGVRHFFGDECSIDIRRLGASPVNVCIRGRQAEIRFYRMRFFGGACIIEASCMLDARM
jgi:hypothetical protein